MLNAAPKIPKSEKCVTIIVFLDITPSLLSAEAGLYLYRSEGFPLTCYFIPGRDGAGAWTFGNVPLPAVKQETQMFLKHTNGQYF